jgi:hypothetical protein
MCRGPAARSVAAVKITSSALIRLFRLLGPTMAGIVGLIFVVVGTTLAASQGWERVTATATSCLTRIERTGNPPSHRNQTTCEMTWRNAAGEEHASSVAFGGRTVANGQTVDLRVSGDTAVEAVPGWWAWGSLALGVALAGGGGVWLWRTFRRAAS